MTPNNDSSESRNHAWKSIPSSKTVNFEHTINIVDFPANRGLLSRIHIAMVFVSIPLPAMEKNPASRPIFLLKSRIPLE